MGKGKEDGKMGEREGEGEGGREGGRLERVFHRHSWFQNYYSFFATYLYTAQGMPLETENKTHWQW